MGLKKTASTHELKFCQEWRSVWPDESKTTTDDEIVEYYRTGEWKLETLIKDGCCCALF